MLIGLLDSSRQLVVIAMLRNLAQWSNHAELTPVEDPKDPHLVKRNKELIQRWKTNPPLES